MKSKAIDGLRAVAVEDSPMFQPRHLTCKSCGGTGRNRTTGGACRVCSKGRLNASSAKGEPMELRRPGEPSGWNQNGEYRTEDRRAALHRALDRVMDARRERSRDEAVLKYVVSLRNGRGIVEAASKADAAKKAAAQWGDLFVRVLGLMNGTGR